MIKYIGRFLKSIFADLLKFLAIALGIVLTAYCAFTLAQLPQTGDVILGGLAVIGVIVLGALTAEAVQRAARKARDD